MTPLYAAQVLKIGADKLEALSKSTGIRLRHVLEQIQAMQFGAKAIVTLEKVRLKVELDPALREQLPFLDGVSTLEVCSACLINFEVSEGHTCVGSRRG